MSLEIKTTIKFRAWRAPNYALLENAKDGDRECHTIPVDDLDEAALEALARAWLEDLYGKTQHTSPFVVIGAA